MDKNIESILLQLIVVLQKLNDVEYTIPSQVLNNSSVGAHTRHIIEHFQSLLNGYDTGKVNYDIRKRDKKIESNRLLAVSLLKLISKEMNKPNKLLALQNGSGNNLEIGTNFFREALYNVEHTIHHMALIRIGLNEVSNITLPEKFGVAPSTIQYKKLSVQ